MQHISKPTQSQDVPRKTKLPTVDNQRRTIVQDFEDGVFTATQVLAIIDGMPELWPSKDEASPWFSYFIDYVKRAAQSREGGAA